MTRDTECRLGVDVGGTFTDLVLVTEAGREIKASARSSTNDAISWPSRA